MIFFRIIPILLIENQNCIKTIKFKKKIYLGDPINIVKIYSELGVDEILINDISNSDIPDFKLLKQISEESFVPLSYGGGVKSFNDIEKILSYGYEKICFNSLNPSIHPPSHKASEDTQGERKKSNLLKLRIAATFIITKDMQSFLKKGIRLCAFILLN